MARLTESVIEDAGGCVTVRFRPSRYLPPQRVGRNVTERQQAILRLLDEAGSLGLRDIHARLGQVASERQIREDLATLHMLGLAVSPRSWSRRTMETIMNEWGVQFRLILAYSGLFPETI